MRQLILGFGVCNTDNVAGVQLSPAPLRQGVTPVGVTFLVSAATKNEILITLSRMSVCRSGSAIASTTKSLSQHKPLFTLSLEFILLHQKKKDTTPAGWFPFSRAPCRS